MGYSTTGCDIKYEEVIYKDKSNKLIREFIGFGVETNLKTGFVCFVVSFTKHGNVKITKKYTSYLNPIFNHSVRFTLFEGVKALAFYRKLSLRKSEASRIKLFT